MELLSQILNPFGHYRHSLSRADVAQQQNQSYQISVQASSQWYLCDDRKMVNLLTNMHATRTACI